MTELINMTYQPPPITAPNPTTSSAMTNYDSDPTSNSSSTSNHEELSLPPYPFTKNDPFLLVPGYKTKHPFLTLTSSPPIIQPPPPSSSFFALLSYFKVPPCLNKPPVILAVISFLVGESRDGLTLLNLQNSYLLDFSGLNEKFLGVLFLCFGLTRCFFQPPMGVFVENTKHKIPLLLFMAYATVALSILTVWYDDVRNTEMLLIIFKTCQGTVMCVLMPCLNALTLGLVGPELFSQQVTLNEMAAHASTSLFHLVCGVYSFYAYNSGNVGDIFYLPIVYLVIFTFVAIHFMKTFTIDDSIARGITSEPEPESDDDETVVTDNMSFDTVKLTARPQTTFFRMSNLPFMFFAFMCFAFMSVNTVLLPLSMQVFASVGASTSNNSNNNNNINDATDDEYSDTYDSGQNDFLFSSMCIVIAQATMVYAASKCIISDTIGRKFVFSLALVILTVRCFVLCFLVDALESFVGGSEDDGIKLLLKLLVLSTALFDGIGAGIFNVLFVVITGDLAAGTGRFPFFIGIVAAAISLGGTVSCYFGEYMAEEIGYSRTFFYHGVCATLILVAFLAFFSETNEPTMKPMAYFFSAYKKKKKGAGASARGKGGGSV